MSVNNTQHAFVYQTHCCVWRFKPRKTRTLGEWKRITSEAGFLWKTCWVLMLKIPFVLICRCRWSRMVLLFHRPLFSKTLSPNSFNKSLLFLRWPVLRLLPLCGLNTVRRPKMCLVWVMLFKLTCFLKVAVFVASEWGNESDDGLHWGQEPVNDKSVSVVVCAVETCQPWVFLGRVSLTFHCFGICIGTSRESSSTFNSSGAVWLVNIRSLQTQSLL